MNDLLNYFIEANLYLVCFYLLYQMLLAGDRNFRFNRAFLLGGIFLSLVLPVLSFNISPANTFEGYIILPAITITEVQTESIGYILKWWHIIGFIYFFGVLFYSSRLIWQMMQIIRNLPLLNSSREKKGGYTLVTTNGEIPTCSFFKFLFWDKTAELSSEEQRQIFEHELAHIQQWHSIDVLLVELLRTVFWFNPAIHLLKSRITEVHEYLADFSATKTIGVESYKTLLTQQIFRSFDFSLSNNFHKSQVIKRIRMLKSTKSKSIWLNALLLIPTLALLITVLSCEVNELAEFTNLNKTKTDSAPTEKNIPPSQTDEIFMEVENQPSPIGGMGQYYEYVQSNLKYPVEAKEAGIEGKVFVQFIVNPEGKLTSVQAVKGIGGGCDEEAVRVVKESLHWKPAEHNGKKVNVRMILPITFKLG